MNPYQLFALHMIATVTIVLVICYLIASILYIANEPYKGIALKECIITSEDTPVGVFIFRVLIIIMAIIWMGIGIFHILFQ
jgi:hypothetical protein